MHVQVRCPAPDKCPYFYIRNHNNSIVALVDENGSVAESYEYTAYGEVTVFDADGNKLEKSFLGNRYTFQGREIDYTTGLYNFRARWYDPETGRWLSKDPIGINGGLNQYVFCGNNPMMFVDPEGMGYDLIGIAPDGSPIYGPERDWGSNYFDPYSGGSSGGKGLTPCPLDFNFDLSNIRDLLIWIMNVEAFFDSDVCPGMAVFVQYGDGGPFHAGALIPTAALTSTLIVVVPADAFAEVVIAPFRFSQPDLPYPTILIYDGYKEAYMKLWNISECDK